MEKILVVRYGTIGDSIFASAFYRELRKALPNALIDALCDKISKGVMKNCPYIDSIIDIDKRDLKSIKRYIDIFKHYDTVFFLKNDSYFTNIAFWSGVKNRIGFKLARNKFLTVKVPYTNDRHEVDCYLDLLRSVNIPVTDTKTEVWIDEQSELKIKKLLDNKSQKKVLIQAFSRFVQKNWINDYWVQIIKYLSDELDIQVYYSGGEKDKEEYDKLTQAMSNIKNPPINLCGNLSVCESFALTKQMDLVIGIDSCSVHIAAALDIPAILIHGSTSLKRWKPKSDKCIVVSKYYPCSPCCLQPGKKKYCKRKIPKCMINLEPYNVINVIKQIFEPEQLSQIPKISVIIPVYNVEKYISRCLDSIINQTLKDIEIICVNDGSKDYSLEILKDYEKRDKRVKVINQENQGLSVARNTGLDNAIGEFVSFIDSDDWISSSDYFEKLYNSAKNTGSDIAVGEVVIGNERYENSLITFEKEEVTQDYLTKLKLCKVPDYCYVWNKIYNRQSLLKTGMKFVPGVIYEDVFFTPKILYYTDKLVTVPNVAYFYYRHANTLVALSRKNPKAKIDNKKAHDEMYKFFREKNIDISNMITKVKKNQIFGITIFKTITKENNKKYILFNFIKWNNRG